MQRVINTIRQPTAWWILLLEGVVALIVGLFILISPTKTAILLLQLVGVYWVISGGLELISLLRNKTHTRIKGAAATIGIVMGLIILLFPLWGFVLFPPLFLFVAAIGGIIYGIMRITLGVREEGWGAIGIGILSIIAGIIAFFLILPLGGRLSVSIAMLIVVLPIILSISAIVIGVLMMLHALHIHQQKNMPQTT